MRGWVPRGVDFKFITQKAYVCTSVMLYADTGNLKLWNQTVAEDDGIDWGQVLQL